MIYFSTGNIIGYGLKFAFYEDKPSDHTTTNRISCVSLHSDDPAQHVITKTIPGIAFDGDRGSVKSAASSISCISIHDNDRVWRAIRSRLMPKMTAHIAIHHKVFVDMAPQIAWAQVPVSGADAIFLVIPKEDHMAKEKTETIWGCMLIRRIDCN